MVTNSIPIFKSTRISIYNKYRK